MEDGHRAKLCMQHCVHVDMTMSVQYKNLMLSSSRNCRLLGETMGPPGSPLTSTQPHHIAVSVMYDWRRDMFILIYFTLEIEDDHHSYDKRISFLAGIYDQSIILTKYLMK